MKALCIDGVKVGDVGRNHDGTYGNAEKEHVIYEGQIYTVMKEVEELGANRYILLEIGFDASYHEAKFIPLSSIDETEMIREIQISKA